MADVRELFLRHRQGDREAFAALVHEYRSPVYSYLCRCGVAEADRDDLFQEIFLKIHATGAQYEAERPLHPWLFTVVANTVRNYVRTRRVRELAFVPRKEVPERETPDPAPIAEQIAAARQETAWLEVEISKLPHAQREVLILTTIENVPQQEVAEILGMPVNTVKTHLRRARMALAEKLVRRKAAWRGEVRS